MYIIFFSDSFFAEGRWTRSAPWCEPWSGTWPSPIVGEQQGLGRLRRHAILRLRWTCSPLQVMVTGAEAPPFLQSSSQFAVLA